MKSCYLCKSAKQDDVRYGKFMEKDGIHVHYYCLLLTSNLIQGGNDNEGFLGFLAKDIKSEAKRISKQACHYCQKPSANVACCASKCRRTFHMICGMEFGALNTFTKTFQSFCKTHVPPNGKQRPAQDEVCSICFDDLGKYNPVTTLLSPCCKNGWFHQYCLASFAFTAGYFFKCPLCNDVKTFRSKLPMKGVFIPDRDAAWELEPDAFSELLERPDTCSAKTCLCSGGRRASNVRNKLLFCHTCGSKAIHKRCIANTRSGAWICDECESISQKEAVVGSSEVEAANNRLDSDDSDDDIDVEGLDDFESRNPVASSMGTGKDFAEPPRNSIRAESDSSENEIRFRAKRPAVFSPSPVPSSRPKLSSDKSDPELGRTSGRESNKRARNSIHTDSDSSGSEIRFRAKRPAVFSPSPVPSSQPKLSSDKSDPELGRTSGRESNKRPRNSIHTDSDSSGSEIRFRAKRPAVFPPSPVPTSPHEVSSNKSDPELERTSGGGSGKRPRNEIHTESDASGSEIRFRAKRPAVFSPSPVPTSPPKVSSNNSDPELGRTSGSGSDKKPRNSIPTESDSSESEIRFRAKRPVVFSPSPVSMYTYKVSSKKSESELQTKSIPMLTNPSKSFGKSGQESSSKSMKRRSVQIPNGNLANGPVTRRRASMLCSESESSLKSITRKQGIFATSSEGNSSPILTRRRKSMFYSSEYSNASEEKSKPQHNRKSSETVYTKSYSSSRGTNGAQQNMDKTKLSGYNSKESKASATLSSSSGKSLIGKTTRRKRSIDINGTTEGESNSSLTTKRHVPRQKQHLNNHRVDSDSTSTTDFEDSMQRDEIKKANRTIVERILASKMDRERSSSASSTCSSRYFVPISSPKSSTKAHLKSSSNSSQSCVQPKVSQKILQSQKRDDNFNFSYS